MNCLDKQRQVKAVSSTRSVSFTYEMSMESSGLDWSKMLQMKAACGSEVELL